MTMDNDQDDLSFVVAYPLPFRVLFLVGVGVLGWAANLHGLRLLGVDAASALDLHTVERGSTSALPLNVDSRHSHAHGAIDTTASLSSPLYRLSFWYGLWCFATWVLYRSATDGNAVLVDFFKYIPAVCSLVVLIFMLCPYDFMHKPERDAFLMYVFNSLLDPIFVTSDPQRPSPLFKK